jgi:hypothetical protein
MVVLNTTWCLSHLAHVEGLDGSVPDGGLGPCLGFGRIVASEADAPNMLANLV